MNSTRLQIDYSLDNTSWHELIDTNNFERQMNRFGRQIPTRILRRFVETMIDLSNYSFLTVMKSKCTNIHIEISI